MVAAMATKAGHRVGLHTSPHLFSFTERMRINGVPAEEFWIAESTEQLADSILDVGATFFEASTAMAFSYFADQRADVAVVEVGMGGRLDATNIVTPIISVITNIGFDHTEHLGKTLAAIAAEKAGIVKTGVPVVSGACVNEAAGVIRAAAQRAGSHLTTTCDLDPEQVLSGIELDLPGSHQRENALVAVTAAIQLEHNDAGLRFDRSGLASTRRLSGVRARCEVLSRNPTIVADVAHNIDGIEAALTFMRDEGLTSESPHVLIGLSRDKDFAGIMDVLASRDAALHVARIDNPRLAPPEMLVKAASDKGLRIVEIGSPNELVKHFRETSAPSGSLLATGSHYVIGALTQDLFEAAGDQ
jgi:dihydrofolate synthase/folylpolyglutamate synthase